VTGQRSNQLNYVPYELLGITWEMTREHLSMFPP
jgi:hypothetical protein